MPLPPVILMCCAARCREGVRDDCLHHHPLRGPLFRESTLSIPFIEHSSDDEDDAAAEAAAQIAVTTIEADLQGVFEQMQVCEEMLSSTKPEQKMPSAAMIKFNESINTVVKRNKVLNAFTRQHHEQEGSDAVLFDTVPSWIPFTRISGYRYRLVMNASASSDFDVLRGALP